MRTLVNKEEKTDSSREMDIHTIVTVIDVVNSIIIMNCICSKRLMFLFNACFLNAMGLNLCVAVHAVIFYLPVVAQKRAVLPYF